MGQPGREALVVCSDESMKIGITVWDVDTGDEILKIPSCAASPYGFLCLRNQCLAASLVNRHGSLGGGAIFMWALNKPHPPRRSYTMEAMEPISCTKDGAYLAGGAPSGNAYLWEVRSGRMLKMWHAHYKSIKCMVFSDDGFLLISGSDDGMICVWSMTRLLKQTSELMHHSDQLDQRLIEMELRSLRSLLHYSLEHKSSVTGLLTISGGTTFFVSSSLDATCKVWDLGSGILIQTQVYPQAVTAIAFHPGEQLLFAGSIDGRIFVSPLKFLLLEDHFIVGEDQHSVLKGHNGSITALAFSASHLISASEDKTVCLWDVTRRVSIRRFNHKKGVVTNLVVIRQSSLLSEVSNCQRKLKKDRMPSLEKYPQLNSLSMEMVILLQSCFFNKDDQCSINIRRTKSLFQHMSELQQEGTPAAMQMKADVNMSQRTWASQMTKHVMEINKHLQSRLLDLMQCRILWYKEIDPVSTKRRKKRKIETPALQ